MDKDDADRELSDAQRQIETMGQYIQDTYARGSLVHPPGGSGSAYSIHYSGGGGAGGGGYAPGGLNLGGGGGGSSSGIPQFLPGGGAGGGGFYGGRAGSISTVIRNTGETGFGETGSDDVPTAAGSVTGYRWWKLPVPDFRHSPVHAEQHWPHNPLAGMRAPWEIKGGVYTAACLAPGGGQHDPDRIPNASCGCGFWAYWHPEDRKFHDAGTVPVFGVIKGFGRFRNGRKGFRVHKARILALHLAFTLMPYIDTLGRPFDPRLTTRTMDDGRQVLLPSSVSYAEAAVAMAHADAWVAVMGDRLEQDYPGVTICETRDRLLASFPPDPSGSLPEPRGCVWCGDVTPSYGHELYCPGRHWFRVDG